MILYFLIIFSILLLYQEDSILLLYQEDSLLFAYKQKGRQIFRRPWEAMLCSY
jgi:hypothetical protein